MGRPKGSKNKHPYPIECHRNSYWNLRVFNLDKELQAFKRMHNRVRDGKVLTIAWGRDFDGFVEFLKEVGPVPHHQLMVKASIGRRDHRKGYEPGNVLWEDFLLNSVKRKGTRYEGDAYPV